MTIKDIANLCGVSVSTVSRAMNGHPDVSEQLRQRILAVVQEVHYVPNSSARDLVRAKQDIIGLVVRGMGNPFFSEVIRAIDSAVTQAGYSMVIHHIRSGEDEILAGAELSRAKRLRGLILLGGSFDYTPNEIKVLDVPFVCCSFTNSFGELGEGDYSSVTVDDRAEAFKATELLLAKGHRRIGIVLDSVGDRSISELRYMGYRSALEKWGIDFDESLVIQTGEFSMEGSYKAVDKALSEGADFTALFAIADSMAIAAIKALTDRGRRVPEDCSVLAIDGIAMTEYTIPVLSTLVQPKQEMGETAVRLLLDMIEGRGGNRSIVLPTAFREGGSLRSI